MLRVEKVGGSHIVKRIFLFCFSITLVMIAETVIAQSPLNANPDVSSLASAKNIVQEMQKKDPQTAQAFSEAIQIGDFQTAKKIYEEFKAKQKDKEAESINIDSVMMKEEISRAIQNGDYQTAQKLLREFEKKKARAEEPQKPSLFERTLSGDFPSDIMADNLQQYGYDIFLKAASSFIPTTTTSVGSDYIIGPNDQFTLTTWGTTEGIYSLQVTKEGKITLPKVGVVSVAGLRFSEMENTLQKHLSKYYSNFNLSIAMGTLKTISVYVVGEVVKPGSYSLTSLTTSYGALFAAGGPTKKGTMRFIKVLRNGKVIKTLDLYDFLLRGDRTQDVRLQQDDTVFVPLIGQMAGVAGSVYRPAIYELKGNESIGDVLQTAGGIMPIAVASRLQVYRFSKNEKKLLLDINVAAQPNLATSMLNDKVQNMDVLSVRPIYEKVWETVNLTGEVRNPGDFQWKQDLKLKEIIKEGQPLPTADLKRVEIIRLTDDYMDRKIIPINIALLKDGDETQNIPLRPKDEIRVYTLFRDAEKVKVSGEVTSPGEYEVQRGERLSDLLRRVGGFTREAYAYGIVFKRLNVKENQSKNLQTLISKLQSQVLQTAAKGAATASSSEETTYAKAELGVNQELLTNLKAMQANLEGRVALNITENIDEWAGSKDDLLLQKGDSLLVPKRPQEVLVMGEVYSPGAQIYEPNMTVRTYIEHTGGMTKYSEPDSIIVIQANGYAFGKDSPNVRNSIEAVKLKPGDAILVPQKVERYAGMRFAKDMIDILFKTAVVLATLTVLF